MNMFLVTMVFIFLIQSSMETNEQTNTPEVTQETVEELEVLSATRQRIRQLLTDHFAL